MKFNKWTLGLAALGVVSLASAARADEAKMSQVQTALSNTTLSGYVDVAAIWRPGTDLGPPSAANPGPNLPASSFTKNDGFSLNAVDIALDKPLDEGPWAAGYHVELMLGPDSPVTGFLNSFNGIRQGYVVLRAPVGPNGLDFKVGVFDTIIGYESTSCPLNPNYTRSFGYSIEPTTHTGVLATYKVSDVLSLSAGVANTWTEAFVINNTATYESQKTYMGSIVFTAPDSFGAMKGASLTLGAINAVDQPFNAGGPGTMTSWYAGLTLPTPSSALKLGASFDCLTFNNRGGGNSQDSIWVAGLFTTISPTDKLSFNLRGEIVDATQIGSDPDPSVSPNPLAGNAAYAGHYATEVTATMQYQIWANVLSRLEFRWDHVDANAFGYSTVNDAPIKKNDFLLALNLVYQF
jgi:hypothetical protein